MTALYRSPSVGEPGYLPYCGGCSTMRRMERKASAFRCERRPPGADLVTTLDKAGLVALAGRYRLKVFRRTVRFFLYAFRFDELVQIICEEQRRAYYEDNYYTRRAQFDDALNAAFTRFLAAGQP